VSFAVAVIVAAVFVGPERKYWLKQVTYDCSFVGIKLS